MTYVPTDPTAYARAKKSKYRNKKVRAGGLSFDSVGERNRYFFLAEAQREGRIRNLQCQVKFALVVNHQLICHYIADFVYEKFISREITIKCGALFDKRPHLDKEIYNWETMVEDFKGGYRLPPDWPIKQKLMKAIHDIDVKIIKNPTDPV